MLGLLQSALSVDKLSRLLKEEYKNDTELLSQLQNRLEGKGVRDEGLSKGGVCGGTEGGLLCK